MTRATVKGAAAAIAQISLTSQGRPSLLQDPDVTFTEAVDLAEKLFTLDAKNVRVVDVTLAANGWRFVLNGGSAISGLTGLNAFTTDLSRMQAVYLPYSVALGPIDALDANDWRVVTDPGGVAVLEIADPTGTAGEVLRLVFENQHAVHATDAAQTSVPANYEQAFETLTASLLLTFAAMKAAQNTGSQSMPNDTVDRRSQSDILRSRAGDLMKIYDRLMGKTATVSASNGSTGPAALPLPMSRVKDLDALYSHPMGSLFHDRRRT